MRTTTMHTDTDMDMDMDMDMSATEPNSAADGSRAADRPAAAASGRTHPARPAATTGPAPATHRRSNANLSLAAGLHLAPETTPAPDTQPGSNPPGPTGSDHRPRPGDTPRTTAHHTIAAGLKPDRNVAWPRTPGPRRHPAAAVSGTSAPLPQQR